MRVVTADQMLSWIVRNIHPEKATDESFECDCHWCVTYSDIISIEGQIYAYPRRKC